MKALALACLALALTAASAVATPYGDPDWPCFSRLVQDLSPGAVWAGPPIDKAGDWNSNAAVADLVHKIAPRSFDAAEGETEIEAFAKKVKAANRPKVLTLLFAGLYDQINGERTATIARIKEFAKRQRNIGAEIGKLNSDLDAIPTDATGDDAKRRDELTQQKIYAAKAFDNAERTVRYACEIPTDLEARLGRYARAIQAQLPS